VVRALQAGNQFKVRALTRNPAKYRKLVPHFQALERSPRLVAQSNVDAYFLDPHRFYPLKVNTRSRRKN
jgi:hypothetical protein